MNIDGDLEHGADAAARALASMEPSMNIDGDRQPCRCRRPPRRCFNGAVDEHRRRRV